MRVLTQIVAAHGGHIGPLAVVQPEAIATAFRTALNIATEGSSSKVSAFLPGTSEATLNLDIEHGMRITFPLMLMSNPRFRRLETISASRSRLHVTAGTVAELHADYVGWLSTIAA
jgi:hypothetical protein